jgi:hypothetical protein
MVSNSVLTNYVLERLVTLNCRVIALFFSLMKRTKNQVIREASLPHGALCPCKASKTEGPVLLPPLSHPQVHASGKITNALTAARPHLFYRLSPEAARLTVLVLTNIRRTVLSGSCS